ncbi:uncharacterized protein LOC142345792 isoform X2 [Convolutriloba macropyga]|uniref:uncharacterized protein LOC142345792 isoform X2 n=1 Tax=Convolutriloba macropyga TaxID=536237 RepID=UPI003F522C28
MRLKKITCLKSLAFIFTAILIYSLSEMPLRFVLKNSENRTAVSTDMIVLKAQNDDSNTVIIKLSLPKPIYHELLPDMRIVSNESIFRNDWNKYLLIYKAFHFEQGDEAERNIVVIGLSHVHHSKVQKLQPKCILWRSHKDVSPMISPATAIRISALHNFQMVNHPSFHYAGFQCHLPNSSCSKCPDTIRLEPRRGSGNSNRRTKRKRKKKKFGYCGSTWYRLDNQTTTHSHRLQEWFEFHIIVGIQFFHISLPPNHLTSPQLSLESMKVLRHYSSLGLVEMRQAPASMSNSSDYWKMLQYMQPLVINDCFLTNRNPSVSYSPLKKRFGVKSPLDKLLVDIGINKTVRRNLKRIKFKEWIYVTDCDQIFQFSNSPAQYTAKPSTTTKQDHFYISNTMSVSPEKVIPRRTMARV